MPEQLQAASTAVDLAQGVVANAARALADRSSADGKISVSRARPEPGARVRPRARGSRRRGVARHVRLRRARRGRVDAGARLRRRRDRTTSRPACSAGTRAWSVDRDALAGAMPFVAEHRDPAFLEALADQCVKHGSGPTHLSDDFELVAETFRRFADDKIRPVAEHVHRTNADVPEDIISGLAELGGFGLSVPEEYGGFADGRRVRLHGHGRRDRGAVPRLARHRRLARHPARDPHPRARRRRHRRAEAGVAAAHRERRADGRHHGDGARLRLRRGGREGHGHPDRRRVDRQRCEDVGNVRGARRRAHAARAHRPRPFGGSPRAVDPDHREAAGRRARLRVRRRPRRQGRGPGDRHHRLPRDALLRGGVRQPVRSRQHLIGGESGRRPGLLSPDGRLRERAAADRGPRRRPDASRVRGGPRVRAGARRVRRAGVRLPALEGEARPYGRTHPGRAPVLLRRRGEDGAAARERSRRRW